MRITLVPQLLIVIVLMCGAGGCSSGDNQQNAQGAASQPTAPPVVPNPDELSGMVSRFYRLLSTPSSPKTATQLSEMLSAHFINAYQDKVKWARDYAFVKNAKPVINDVSNQTVDYTVSYDYLGSDGYRIGWIRNGKWVFVHGSSGWQMDQDRIVSSHLVEIQPGKKLATIAIHSDIAYADGHHTFPFYGGTGEFFVTKDGSWKTDFAPPPTPTPVSQEPPRFVPDHVVAQPAAPRGATDCEQVSVEAVYQDGEILKLDDGRLLRVESYDTPTSSVWVPPFDGIWCDSTDKFTNTDDNESVDLAP